MLLSSRGGRRLLVVRLPEAIWRLRAGTGRMEWMRTKRRGRKGFLFIREVGSGLFLGSMSMTPSAATGTRAEEKDGQFPQQLQLRHCDTGTENWDDDFEDTDINVSTTIPSCRGKGISYLSYRAAPRLAFPSLDHYSCCRCRRRHSHWRWENTEFETKYHYSVLQ